MKLLIQGGNVLCGKISAQGSKNSVLPILAATLLIKGKSVIHNCPRLTDVDAAVGILTDFGCKVTRENSTLTVDAENVNSCRVSELLSRRMRSSILFLGPAVSRLGKAEFSFPGGCEIGRRPIDLHLSSLKLLGADISEYCGMLTCCAENGFKGNRIHLSFPSVGATETVLLSAAISKGTTVLINAAREPEIIDLAHFLTKAGARIIGAGEKVVVIFGAPALSSIEYKVMPDRIVTATYLFSAAITGGEIEVTNTVPSHLQAVYPVLEQTGCTLKRTNSSVYLKAPEKLRAVRTVKTLPYPGFPTDLQSPVTALLSVAEGTSVVAETIFENRYKHINELIKLGANIRIQDRTAIIEGVEKLGGAYVKATDLRGGFALVIAALKAQGKTVIDNIYHIDRGYEAPEKILSSLGADIKRIT